ncbi:MAG TPA: MltA domain-containing protein, partial [Gallionella sp.]|nr:MltA domain-containing protein [Gallionella sp.]
MRFKSALLPLIFLAACAAPSKPPVVPPVALPAAPFAVSKWEMLPDWQTTDLQPAWAAFLQSCRALKGKPGWQTACARAGELAQPGNAALRVFFEESFTPYQVFNPDGSSQGLITGYYEPKLAGSRVRTGRFRYPLYAVPDDLLT